jgi:hypothetical protein
MEASSRSHWQCSTCTYAENKWAAIECEMCGAAVCTKRPASPVPASVAVAPKPSKLSRKTAVAKKKPPPQDPPPPMHPSGVVIDVVETNRGDHGHSCEEHPDACGTAVLTDDVIVRIRKEQILIKDCFRGKGKMKEETALTINWVSDGID